MNMNDRPCSPLLVDFDEEKEDEEDEEEEELSKVIWKSCIAAKFTSPSQYLASELPMEKVLDIQQMSLQYYLIERKSESGPSPSA
ncbi:hypothetical protein BGZ54_001448 [Gamsiella multidivaricata]|nr:hypothetical protein BGZ54_001448 [Gamsiella multidivaricata]